MRNIIASFLAFLALAFLLPQQALALSCVRTYPSIATIESVDLNLDNSSTLNLKWAYTFPDDMVSSASPVLIDSYSTLVESYIADELDVFSKIDELEDRSVDFSSIEISPDFSSQLNVSVDDIVISAPPIHVCDQSLLLIYDSQARLKQFRVKGDFLSYSFNNQIVSVEPGKEIECQGYSCSVKANFKISEREASLVPSQELKLEGSIFSRVLLKTSRAPEKGADAQTLFPWGMGRLVEYIVDVDLNQVKSQDDTEGDTDEGDTDEGEQSGQKAEQEIEEDQVDEQADSPELEEAEKEKRENIFKRFFAWLASIWR